MAEAKRGNKSMEEMMEVYRKLGIPGAPHKTLAGLAGSWTSRTTYWMEAGREPMESEGTCEQKMILDGRFLEQTYHSVMMGKDFTGINLLGYDNHTNKYVSVWLDSMSTGIYFFEGTEGPGPRTFTQECRFVDPVRGPLTWRSVTRLVENDKVIMEAYITPQSGSEEKMMEMTLTRKR